jgi:hypothetical protein
VSTVKSTGLKSGSALIKTGPLLRTGALVSTGLLVTSAGSPPVNTVAPVISGSNAIGGVLSTTNGTWTNSPSSYTYQWNSNGSPIGGATSSTYTVQAGDAGNALTCVVSAQNGAGTGVATSNSINAQIAMTVTSAIGLTNAGSSTFTTYNTVSTDVAISVTGSSDPLAAIDGTAGGGGNFISWTATASALFSQLIPVTMDVNAFAIPSDARIDGIEVHYQGWTASGSGIVHQEDLVSLALNGASIGLNLWNTSVRGLRVDASYPTGGVLNVVGGPTELWGLPSITPAQINDPSFGAWLRFKRNGTGGPAANLDYVEIKVYYTRYVNSPVEVIGIAFRDVPFSAAGLSSFDITVTPGAVASIIAQSYTNTADLSNNGATNNVSRTSSGIVQNFGVTNGALTDPTITGSGSIISTQSTYAVKNKLASGSSFNASSGSSGTRSNNWGKLPVTGDQTSLTAVPASVGTNYFRSTYTPGSGNPARIMTMPIQAARSVCFSVNNNNQGVITNVSSIGYVPKCYILLSGQEHGETYPATGHDQWVGGSVGFGKWRDDGSTYGVYDTWFLEQKIQLCQNHIGIGYAFASGGCGEAPHGHIQIISATSPAVNGLSTSNPPMVQMHDYWINPPGTAPPGSTPIPGSGAASGAFVNSPNGWTNTIVPISGGVQFLWDNGVSSQNLDNGFQFLGFDPPVGYDSWIGVVTMPTTTGVKNFSTGDFTSAIPFTPSCVLLIASLCPNTGTYNTQTVNGTGFAFVPIVARSGGTMGWREEIEGSTTTSAAGMYFNRTGVWLKNHDGTDAYLGTIPANPFVSGGFSIDFTSGSCVDGTDTTPRMWMAIAFGLTGS